MALDLAGANLLGTLFELFLFGVYCTVSLDHVKILYHRRNRSGSFIFIAVTTLVLFLLISMHAIIDTHRMFSAFIDTMAKPFGPLAFFGIYKSTESTARTAITCVTVIVSDLFLTYRTFVIWRFSYLIAIIPSLLLMADVGLTILLLISLDQTIANQPFAITLIGTRAKWFWLVTLAENLLCTFLIAGKIWYINRSTGRFRVLTITGATLSRIMTIILESAAIYSIFLIALIACNATGNAGYFTINNMLGPIVGIVFSTILVRSTAGEEGNTLKRKTAYSSMHFTNPGGPTSPVRTQSNVGAETTIQLGSSSETETQAAKYDDKQQPFSLEAV